MSVPCTDYHSRRSRQYYGILSHKRGCPAGRWDKDEIFCFNNIKLNIFMEGDFSVIVDGRSYSPVYGDICVLAPGKLHCGQILKPTHNDYYQLDVGVEALAALPDGKELVLRLLNNCAASGPFMRPSENDINKVIRLCEKLERAIAANERALAFAYVVEILYAITRIGDACAKVSAIPLTRITRETVKYIENNFASEVKIEPLAEMLGVSASYLSRVFKKDIGVGIHEYLIKYRVLKASYLLRSHSVTDVGYMCGFSESSHFISVFKRHFDCTPMAYKKEICEKNIKKTE